MNGPGDTMLLEEVEKTIKALERPPTKHVCGEHETLTTGVTMLLKVQRHELRRPDRRPRTSRGQITWIATVMAALVAGLVEGLRRAFGP